MSDSEQLPASKPAQKLAHECVKGLGYCCPAVFLQIYPAEKNATIALRLGVSIRTVQRWRLIPFRCEKQESGQACHLNRFPMLTRAQIELITSKPPC